MTLADALDKQPPEERPVMMVKRHDLRLAKTLRALKTLTHQTWTLPSTHYRWLRLPYAPVRVLACHVMDAVRGGRSVSNNNADVLRATRVIALLIVRTILLDLARRSRWSGP